MSIQCNMYGSDDGRLQSRSPALAKPQQGQTCSCGTNRNLQAAWPCFGHSQSITLSPMQGSCAPKCAPDQAGPAQPPRQSLGSVTNIPPAPPRNSMQLDAMCSVLHVHPAQPCWTTVKKQTAVTAALQLRNTQAQSPGQLLQLLSPAAAAPTGTAAGAGQWCW